MNKQETTEAGFPGLCQLQSFADLIAWTKRTCFDNPSWSGEDQYCAVEPLSEREVLMIETWCKSNSASFYYQPMPDGRWMVGVVEKMASPNKRRQRIILTT